MGVFPKWFSEFQISDFWEGFKKDAQKIPSTIGDVISSVTKPILSGVRSALTPTMIWLLVIAVIGLILFKNYKKILG